MTKIWSKKFWLNALLPDDIFDGFTLDPPGLFASTSGYGLTNVYYEDSVTTREDILATIVEERNRQHLLWGDQSHHSNEKWLTILVEEVGEVANAILEDEPPEWLCSELVQVAAVAVQWLEILYDRDSDNKET